MKKGKQEMIQLTNNSTWGRHFYIYFWFPAEHAAPPKKPPRPGAQSQVGSLACLNTGDSYNDGVKVHVRINDVHNNDKNSHLYEHLKRQHAHTKGYNIY